MSTKIPTIVHDEEKDYHNRWFVVRKISDKHLGPGFEGKTYTAHAKIVAGWSCDSHDGNGAHYVPEKVIVYNGRYAERSLTIDEAKECVETVRNGNKVVYVSEKEANQLQRDLEWNRTS